MAGLSLCVALAAVVLAVVLVVDRSEPDPCCAPPPIPSASPAGAAAVLHDLMAAIDERDGQSAASLARRDDEEAAASLAAVARNARLLDLRGVSARYVTEVGTVDQDGSWSALVALTWRIHGFDRTLARTEVLVTFAQDRAGGEVRIAGFGGADARGRTPLWLHGPLEVVRMSRPRVLVLADGSRASATATAERVRAGVAVVRRTLPGWTGSTVVEVPASARALDEVLGAETGTYAGVAAVTAPVDGSARPQAPVHVFVNPDVGRGLRSVGAQVVMSHELTHLATGAVRSPVDPWLLEGFADWVALRDLDLPDHVTLGRAIALVRRQGVPDHLPGAAELDPRAPDLQAAYEQAWLACRILAERAGADALVRLYRRVHAGAPLDAELRRAGVPADELRRAWRTRLTELTGRRADPVAFSEVQPSDGAAQPGRETAEVGVEAAAEQSHTEDDRHGDESDEQAVFSGGGTVFVSSTRTDVGHGAFLLERRWAGTSCGEAGPCRKGQDPSVSCCSSPRRSC